MILLHKVSLKGYSKPSAFCWTTSTACSAAIFLCSSPFSGPHSTRILLSLSPWAWLCWVRVTPLFCGSSSIPGLCFLQHHCHIYWAPASSSQATTTVWGTCFVGQVPSPCPPSQKSDSSWHSMAYCPWVRAHQRAKHAGALLPVRKVHFTASDRAWLVIIWSILQSNCSSMKPSERRLAHFSSAERQGSPPQPISVCMATVGEWQHIKENHLGKIIAKTSSSDQN